MEQEQTHQPRVQKRPGKQRGQRHGRGTDRLEPVRGQSSARRGEPCPGRRRNAPALDGPSSHAISTPPAHCCGQDRVLRTTLTTAAATLLATLTAASVNAQPPGYGRFDIPAEHRAGLLAGSIWYPSAVGGHPGLIGDNPAWIAAPGFSMGGATVLMTVGARFDIGPYAEYCAGQPEPVDCVFFRSGGVDPAAMPGEVGADLNDPRLTGAFAVDPGFGYAFSRGTLAAIVVPVLLMNLGSIGPGSMWNAVDAGPEGTDLAGAIPAAGHRVIDGAMHFSLLALCNPGAEEMLVEEDDDPICTDPEGNDRAGTTARSSPSSGIFSISETAWF